RVEVEERADEWTRRLKTEVEGGMEDTKQGTASEEAFDEDVLVTAAGQALEEADREHGGFGKGQKFPHPSRLDVLLRAHHRTGNASFLDVAEETLDAMAEGGLYDHVGGGFHRYCTDRVDGYRALGDERYAEVVDETVEFVDRELGHPDGGFYSTLDARSPEGEGGEHEEGAFYVWTPDEVHEAVDDDTAAGVFCDYYGVTEEGNFEGSNVLTVSERVDEIAEDRGMSEGSVEELLDEARDAVFEAREERPRPGRDEKVLAGWNGLMVSALSRADFVLDAGYAERAEEALGFVRENLWDADERELRRRYKDGEAAVDGYLEDYAFLARGALDLYQATQDLEHLGFALELCRAVVE
ncbi:MAG: thioredoxin domain-containing protein, partial [Halobacteria archaeon]|nr:thioredoxin domain-containing protein [Halobacteria archaeon]